MPFCNEHNEVYRGEECPICVGKETEEIDSAESGISASDDDKLVSNATDSTAEDINTDAVDGDLVVGSQEKSIDNTEITKVDQSETTIDESTAVSDNSTKIDDSIVQGSDIGGGEGSTEVTDSVVKDSDVGQSSTSGPEKHRGHDTLSPTEPSDRWRREGAGKDRRESKGRKTSGTSKQRPEELSSDSDQGESAETKFCLHCGEEIPGRATHCPICDRDLNI